MVLKSKGGKKSRSSISQTRKKNEMKHHRKTNYKKKKQKQIECCICYEMAPDNSDNTITCGKTNHPLCANCKIKVDDTGGDCPMCRSHRIPLPKSQMVDLRVMKTKIPVNSQPFTNRKVQLEGAGNFDGIYWELWKDKHRMSMYWKNEGSVYLYRTVGKDPAWVLNSHYEPKAKYCYGYLEGGKLVGKSNWKIINVDNDKWDNKRVKVTDCTVFYP